jgi:hypothetical protein
MRWRQRSSNAGARADQAITSDIELKHAIEDPAAALEHALLYLHDNRVLELDRGRAVFHSAMTIEVNAAAARRRFNKDDFAPLEEFYRERTLQTHVMHEYARLGSDDPARAAALVNAYFTQPRRQFVRSSSRGAATCSNWRPPPSRSAASSTKSTRCSKAWSKRANKATTWCWPGRGRARPGSSCTASPTCCTCAGCQPTASSRWPSTAARPPSCAAGC